MHVRGQGGENRPQVEQFVLHAPQDHQQQSDPKADRARTISSQETTAEASESVQLINSSVSFNARRVLGDALPAREAGFAGVAAFCINAIERDTRVVESLVVHALYVTRCGVSPPAHTVGLCRDQLLEKSGRRLPESASSRPRRSRYPFSRGDSGSPFLSSYTTG